jgi:hypothetical protein
MISFSQMLLFLLIDFYITHQVEGIGNAPGFAMGTTGGGNVQAQIPANIAQLKSWLADAVARVILLVSDHAIIASVSCGMLPRERMLSLISFFLLCLFFLLERVCSLSLMHDHYPFFFFVCWLFFPLGE